MREIKDTFLEDSKISLIAMKNRIDALGNLDIKNINPKKTIIFNIDINNGFAIEGPLSSPRVKDLIPGTNDLLLQFSNLGVQIVAFTDAHTDESLEINRGSYPMHCKKGSLESNVVDEIASIPNILILEKNTTNAFMSCNPLNFEEMNYNTIGKSELDEVDTYIITGCCSDLCIADSISHLLAYLNQHNRKGEIIVPLNLIDTYDSPSHNADLMNIVFLNHMLDNGIKVVKEIIY